MAIKDIFVGFTMLKLGLLLIGILLGLVLISLFYILSAFLKIRHIQKKQYTKDLDDNVRTIINNTNERYKIESGGYKLSKKVNTFLTIIIDELYDIAHYYYPLSSNPLYEINFEEIIIAIDKMEPLIYEILNSSVALRLLKNQKIATFLKIKETIEIFSTTLNITQFNQVSRLYTVVRVVMNFFNPIYWVKKITVDLLFYVVWDKIVSILLEYIGVSASSLYSEDELIGIEYE